MCRCAPVTCQWLIYSLICMQQQERLTEERQRERIILSEHDLESIYGVCVCVWCGECSLLLTCHWLLSDAGADSGEGGRIWDAALSAEYLQPRGGPSNQGRWPRSRGHSEAVALFPREQTKTRQTFIKTGNAMKRLDLEAPDQQISIFS